MPASQRDSARTGRRLAPDQAESALVGHYGRWVRLAYLTLPADLGRHRRVLAAHGLVQRALPRVRSPKPASRVPGQSRGTPAVAPTGDGAPDDGSTVLRERVVRVLLAYDTAPSRWPFGRRAARGPRTALPVVWGLRLFPRPGGPEAAALDQALARVPTAARAAFVLRHLEGLDDGAVRAMLVAAGAAEPEAALRVSYGLDRTLGASEDLGELLRGAEEFDACSLRARPTDLRRRRRRFRLALAAAACATAGAVAVGTAVVGRSEPPAPREARVPGPEQLVHASNDTWADTAKVDFSAWPARGSRTSDRDLLGRALDTWADPPSDTRVTTSAGARTEPVAAGVRLLYAGEVDGRAVVLLHAPERLVRYTEPTSSDGRPTLDFTEADGADVTTAAAVAVSREDGRARYLTAPWVAEAQTRDLLRPDSPGEPLDRTSDGVTSPVPLPPTAAGTGGGGCDTWPVLQLRSSVRIVEKHSFLLTDLGGVSPAHLTYTPLPDGEVPSRQPREATGPAALGAWARTACGLAELDARDVRAVNVWDFAEQDLPEDGGRAVWACTRATTWRGPGEIQVRLRTPAESPTEPARLVAGDRDTAACGRFGQHLVAGTVWEGESGRRYALAAGSRDVTRVALSGAAEASEDGRTLQERLPAGDPRPRLSADLRDEEARPVVCASWTAGCDGADGPG
ncbi:hypothetical protein [Streptomyces phytohabitans]|uniref:hypothetical protein n=1 Tax=Streptomyces phytohabitans TaxID=1150371 RepID=UPI00345C26FF